MLFRRILHFFFLAIVLALPMATIAQQAHQVIGLNGMWRFTIGDNKEYASPTYDDKSWEKIYVPANWEDEGFHGYDGYAWYRREFAGEFVAQHDNLFLNMGYIDDVDQVFLNGHLIGYSGTFPPNFQTAWNAQRIYPIPAEYLNKSGKNVLAVRVYDVIHQGGIVSGDIGIFAPKNLDGFLSLEGLWRFKEGRNAEWQEPRLNDADWPHILVPASWRTMDHRFKYREGWYRRTFVLPATMHNIPLNLLLGKIDDFDEVYLNGELIGKTNDGLPFGRSRSFQEFRNYPIPLHLLKPGENVIAVKVIDLGNNAGIYEGPVGIVSPDKVRKVMSEYR